MENIDNIGELVKSEIDFLEKELKDKNLKINHEDNKWNLANKIIYDICETYREHTTKNVIAKTWLIGRAYSAQLERRKNASKDEPIGSFYEEKLVGLMKAEYNGKKISEYIDEKINELGENQEINADNLYKIIEFHKDMVEIFRKITNMENRSFVSKYLHFHLPKLYFIYDKNAKSEITTIVKIKSNTLDDIKKVYKLEDTSKYDKEYCNFFIKAYLLQQAMTKSKKEEITPREVDIYLLRYGQ